MDLHLHTIARSGASMRFWCRCGWTIEIEPDEAMTLPNQEMGEARCGRSSACRGSLNGMIIPAGSVASAAPNLRLPAGEWRKPRPKLDFLGLAVRDAWAKQLREIEGDDGIGSTDTI